MQVQESQFIETLPQSLKLHLTPTKGKLKEVHNVKKNLHSDIMKILETCALIFSKKRCKNTWSLPNKNRKTLGFEKGREANIVSWTVQTIEQPKQEQNETYLKGRKRLDLADMNKNWQDESGGVFCVRMF